MTDVAAVETAAKTPDERKAILADAVAGQVRKGWGVQSQTDFQAVLVRGHRPNHLLHLILSIVTLGLWIPVWIVLSIVKRERHRVVQVDGFGNVNVQ